MTPNQGTRPLWFAVREQLADLRVEITTGIANQLALQLTRLEQEFGMTAASRTRLHVDMGEEDDEFESYLKANRG